MYAGLRRLFFCLDAERAHSWALAGLKAATWLGVGRKQGNRASAEPVELMGLRFPNRVGLAAGLDKNGAYIEALAALGFGFLEIGTVTPRPQPGNPRPRVFRLADRRAIINRLGFNNAGVEKLVANVQASRYDGVLGVNIGKNRGTPLASAIDDYRYCLERVYGCADYVTINISSPNTPGLRELQGGDALHSLLDALKSDQHRLHNQGGRYVPLAVKIAPDIDHEAIAPLARALVSHEVDGLIATNTTVRRDAIAGHAHADESGGLSGAPLFEPATEVLRSLRAELGDDFPIIGVGGVLSGADARAKRAAGADLVQVYSGLIYRGPALVNEMLAALQED